MFGLNDDDKDTRRHTADAPLSGPTHNPIFGEPDDDSPTQASPFAAAYSSLSGGHQSDQPSPSPAPAAVSVPNEDLLHIKSEALRDLAPLVGHLEQSPEEKFKTAMMMIQASDNPELIRDAYAAANQIPDQKIRAQALLDVVNEINYFTRDASS